ncbi:MAG: hypothetical protein J1D88_10100 [Treponema sp.]|nr:hypothetical protein [Treponema sp.]
MKKERLKSAAQMARLILTPFFFQNSVIQCRFSLCREKAFPNDEKLDIFSSLEIQEGYVHLAAIPQQEQHTQQSLKIFYCYPGAKSQKNTPRCLHRNVLIPAVFTET